MNVKLYSLNVIIAIEMTINEIKTEQKKLLKTWAQGANSLTQGPNQLKN